MSDFHPVSIYFILHESIGIWLWALLALALVLLAAIAIAIVRLRRTARPAKRPLIAALVAGLATTAVFTFLVPVWTLTGPGAFSAPVDYAIAILLALVPGTFVGSTVFAFLALGSPPTAGKSSLMT